jgi:hypothetical protein
VLTTVSNDADTLATDITTVRNDIGTVQADQTALSSPGLPGTPGAGKAISAAQAALFTANGYIGHAKGDLRTAYAVANSVGTGACAGDGPGSTPDGVGHLR